MRTLARTMATGDWLMDRDLERYFDSEESEVNEANIEARVKAVAIQQLAVNDITVETVDNDAHLARDLGFDSIDLVEVVIGIEDEFGLEISDEAGEKLVTVQQVIDYVKANVNA